MSIAAAVEEADIEICSSGFDNLLAYDDAEELRQHAVNLKSIGAEKCSKVIEELLSWLESNSDIDPLELVESDPDKVDAIWERYNTASTEENPRELAKAQL